MPALVIGLGGYAEVLDDVAIVPLPADPARVERAILQLKGAALLGTADLPAAARLLERRERLGGACTLERPFENPDFVVSPCAYVVGLLDEVVIQELQLKQRGLKVHVADPNLWVPFEDGTSFGQWLDDARTQRDLDTLKVSAADQKGYWAYEHLFDEIRKRLRTGERDTWIGESPTRAELEELLHGEQTMIDVVFEASIAEVLDEYMGDQRLKDALFGQGIIGAWAGPHDKGTASIKLMHYQGDLEGGSPIWGYVRGGMGRRASRSPMPPRRPGPRWPPACPSPNSAREGVVLEDGTRINATTVVCNADPKVALRLLGEGAGRPPRAPGGVAAAQPGGQVQRRARPPAELDRRTRPGLPRPWHGQSRSGHDPMYNRNIRSLPSPGRFCCECSVAARLAPYELLRP